MNLTDVSWNLGMDQHQFHLPMEISLEHYWIEMD